MNDDDTICMLGPEDKPAKSLTTWILREKIIEISSE